MDDLTSLLLLSILMFVLTFIVGYLPMMIKLSEKNLETISVIGAGFLLGTSLIVILPEGLEVLLETKGVFEHNHESHELHNHENDKHEHSHTSQSNENNQGGWAFWGQNRRLLLLTNNENENENENDNSELNNLDSYLKHEKSDKIWLRFSKNNDNNNNIKDKMSENEMRYFLHNRRMNSDSDNKGNDKDNNNNKNEEHSHDHNDNDDNNKDEHSQHDHNHHQEQHSHEHGEHSHDHDPRVHSVFREMGMLVSFGFIFMMAIEKLSGGDHGHDHGSGGGSHSHSHEEHSHSHAHSHTHGHTSVHGQNGHSSSSKLINNMNHENEMESLISNSPKMNKIQIINSENNNNTKENEESAKNKQRTQTKLLSFMVGLLTHAAVDGIALGAVSAEGNAQSLSLLVFVALMGHKAPAAVSVTTFLKRKAHPRKEIIKQIVAFSAAAPVFALLTYFILDTLFVDLMGGSLGGSDALGWCLLFSGGTFLYVVTLHILPEIKSWRGATDFQLTWKDIALLTIGVVIPSFFEHSH